MSRRAHNQFLDSPAGKPGFFLSAPDRATNQAASDERQFLQPEPELVETIRAGLEAHKRSEQERNARWIAHCLKELRKGAANA